MNAPMPTSGNLYLIVGYDGSDPAVRALDTAVALLKGREGSIEVLYVAHLTTAEMLSPDAVAEVEESFGEIARDLRTQATEQLRGKEDRWTFGSAQGVITDVLGGAAEKTRDAHPGEGPAAPPRARRGPAPWAAPPGPGTGGSARPR